MERYLCIIESRQTRSTKICVAIDIKKEKLNTLG